jgi:hypothetical protein
LENPVPSQAGHLISATASFDLSLFIKIALQKEQWYPSRSRTPTPFPPTAHVRAHVTDHRSLFPERLHHPIRRRVLPVLHFDPVLRNVGSLFVILP